MCVPDHVADFCTVRQPPLAFIRSLTTTCDLVTRSLSSDPEQSQTLQLQTGGQV